MASCLGYYIVGSGNGWAKKFSQKTSMFLFLKCDSSIIDTAMKVASLSLQSVEDLSIISGHSIDHRHQHDPFWQHGLQTSWEHLTAHKPMTSQATWLSEQHASWTTNMSPGGSPFHRDDHGLSPQHQPQTSSWPLVVTQTIDKTWPLPHGQVQ